MASTLGALKQRHFKSPFEDHHHHLLDQEDDDIRQQKLRNSKDRRAASTTFLTFTPSTIFSFSKPCLSAWFFFSAFLFSICLITFQFHYSLPTPVDSGYNSLSGEIQFSEHNVRKVVKHLANDIGYRVVGTEQELEAKNWIIRELSDLQQQAKMETVKGVEGLPNFDMWVQVGDGSHRFDFMSKVVMKMYTNMTNIIVRLSCGEECDQNAILINSHYDTTLGSPGAADDALGVGIMMEIIRIMSLSTTPRKNSAVFLFNGGEESLQDASHSFITNHELKDSIRAVVNLEACGTTGPEILFQANSLEMIKAYRTVPYPHGTVLANDVFSTGLILSDTDFRQFVEYGNLTGLDMAVYKNSYLYHTRLDVDEYLEDGVAQHMGENSLALMNYLTTEASLINLETTSNVVFFDLFGKVFIVYSWAAAMRSHIVIAGLAMMAITVQASRPTLRATASIALSFVASLLVPNLSVIFLQSIGKPMQWFSHEWLPLLLFGPMAMAGQFFVQLCFHDNKASNGANELSTLSAIQLFFTIVLALSSYIELASSYVFGLYSVSATVALFFNAHKASVLAKQSAGGSTATTAAPKGTVRVDLLTYFVMAFAPTAYFSYTCYSLLDLFIPLTGRIGVDAPVDHIVAILTGFTCFVFCPPLLALSHRFGRSTLKRMIVLLSIVHMAILLITSVVLFPYTETAPKRVFAQHLKNLTSGESMMYIAQADPGPFYDPIVTTLEGVFDAKASFRSGAENPGDWNALYPFNQFLDSYTFDTTPYIKSKTNNLTISGSQVQLTDFIHNAPRLIADSSSYDPITGTRKLSILCSHPTFIWTVASFNTHLVKWSLPSSEPFPYFQHYVIRHVGGHESDGWRLDLEYKATGPDDKLWIELTALETEGFGNDVERELIGGGDIGVMRAVKQKMPIWGDLTYFGSVCQTFML